MNIYNCPKNETGDHCWHSTNQFLPPQEREKCCWCGQTRTLTRFIPVDVLEHGMYVPDRSAFVEAVE